MKKRYVLAPECRADESLSRVFSCLHHSLRSNVSGVLEGTDPEFLHELRVATRRTRTALTQIKDVLPPTVKDTFAPEFKWLGAVTGPLRDLDVHLSASAAYRSIPGIQPDALSGLQTFLEDARRSQRRKVITAIRSARFQRLVDDWSKLLEPDSDPSEEPPLASSPVVDVAAPQIFKAYRRLRNRGAGAGVDAPAPLLHRLRIDGKNLRYLLEFFVDLFPRDTVKRFIVELKKLQNVLGEFNDSAVQLTHLDQFEEQSYDSTTATLSTRAPTSRLTEVILERQLGLRTGFVDCFMQFSSTESHRLYKETFKAL